MSIFVAVWVVSLAIAILALVAENSRLREENAALRERLAKVVEAGNEMADWIGDEQHLQVRVWRAVAKGE